MIPEVTIKITMTEGTFTTATEKVPVTTGGETIPPPPQDVEGVAEIEAYVPPVPQGVSAGIEGNVAPPDVLEGTEEGIAIPPPPQEAIAQGAEDHVSEFVPPGEGQGFAEGDFSIPPVPEEDPAAMPAA